MTERVVCAANRYRRWGDKQPAFIIVCGVRHHDAIMNSAIRLYRRDAQIAPDDHGEQGFVNQRGEFLTRKEAWVVAQAAGQIFRRVGGDEAGVLYSENYC